MTQAVSIPRPLLKELYEHFDRIEEILATLEELSDKKGQIVLKNIRKMNVSPFQARENQRSPIEGLNLPYETVLTKSFQKEFRKLPKVIQDAIIRTLEKTTANPYSEKKLRSF